MKFLQIEMGNYLNINLIIKLIELNDSVTIIEYACGNNIKEYYCRKNIKDILLQIKNLTQ